MKRKMHQIECKTCSTKFKPLFEDSHYQQAYGCSTDVTEVGLSGNYGSTNFDMTIGEWLVGRPNHIGLGLICDKCIDKNREHFIIVSRI